MPDQVAAYLLDPPKQDEALKDFIVKHARSYDPVADDYDRSAFAMDIKEDKNDPIYSAHSYHTKVPPRGIIPYILHYTQPGDLVLDVFSGSGMTGVAAQACGEPPVDILEQFPEMKDRVGPRACVLNDLSPAACHIAYNYNTPVDGGLLKSEFERVRAAVRDDLDWLYGTEHYEPALGAYDPTKPGAASRLKNPPNGKYNHSLLGEEDRTWELLTKAEVEARLGYPVTALPRDGKWGDLDVAEVEHWVCIPAAIQYTVWSDVYRCEGFVTLEEATGKISARGKNVGKPILRKKMVHRGCKNEFTLWQAAVDLPGGQIKDIFACPHCNEKWGKKQLQRLRDAPVLVTYQFGYLLPSGQLRLVRRDRPPTAKEIAHLRDIQAQPITYWHPTQTIDMGREMMRHGMSKQNLSKIADFWSIRNCRALANIWDKIQKTDNSRVRAALSFAFTAIVFRVSRRRIVYFPKGGGWASTVISGTLYIPSLNAEANVWSSFANKAEEIFPLASQIHPESEIFVHRGDAADLSAIPSETVDYVFADPPFGQNIYYADCSLLWEGWLDDFTDEAKEIVVNERRQGGVFKKLEDYRNLMEQVFGELFRVLKPNRFATIEFNNSDGAVFEAIKRALLAAGFHIDNMLLLDKTGKTYKQMKAVVDGEDVVDKDVLFNLHKPAVFRAESRGEDQDLEQQVADAVRQHLQTLPERIKTDPARYNDEHRTTATINSMLMNSLIPRGVSVERLNLPFIERVCARYFRKVGQHWYLRGESVGGDNGNALFEEEVDVKDELTAIAWLRQKVQQKAMLLGELKPLWMRATGLLPEAVSRGLSLDMLLAENFWRDSDSNRWREPTDEEREEMNDDRSIRVLHDAERFIAGSLRRTTTDVERCEWIEVLFMACRQVEEGEIPSVPALRGFDADEGYRLVTRLFQSILREKVPESLYARAQKQAGVASNRISRSVRDDDELRKAEAEKGKSGWLFDEVV
jgi:16S rRNA G966 N2-methylase RsmD